MSFVLLISCSKESPLADAGVGQHDIVVSVNTHAISSVGDDPKENEINLLTVLSFFKLPGQNEYVYETSFVQSDIFAGLIKITLNGSFPRILYYFANSMENISYTGDDLRELTPSMFEESAYLTGNSLIPASPFCLVAKQECPDPSAVKIISVELAHTVARIDIDNQYPAFAIDSMVLNNAASGSYLFNDNVSKSTISKVNYGNPSLIYMYQTTNATLSFYGKYNNIRTAFDVPLSNIKAGTKYRLTLRSSSDTSLSSNNILWDINDWSNGNNINTTPDQK